MKPKILITGASGLIGKRFVKLYENQYTFVKLSRRVRDGYFVWNPKINQIDTDAVFDIDYVVHLAGDNIAGRPWTKQRKINLLKSRTDGTKTLTKAFVNNTIKPKHIVAASATGFYGDSGDTIVNENSLHGAGFLSDTTQAWEASNRLMGDLLDTKVTLMRLGMVLANEGGALPALQMPTKMGIAPLFEKGKPWISWVHIDDVCHAIHHAINLKLEGTYNITASKPERLLPFTKAIVNARKGRALFFLVPSFLVRLVIGDLITLFTNSVRCSNNKIKSTGFEFKYESAIEALQQLESKKNR
jgi:uncharacterized protein (TIGR01777 family)